MPVYQPIPGRPFYEAGDDGSIRRRLKKGGYSPRTPCPDYAGYLVVRAGRCPDGKTRLLKAHRLVLEAFVGPCPEGMVACHNNGDRADNRAENLRWDTPSNNNLEKRRHGTAVRGSRNNKSKLLPSDVREIRKRLEAGESLSFLGRAFGVSHVAIRLIRDGVNWAWLD